MTKSLNFSNNLTCTKIASLHDSAAVAASMPRRVIIWRSFSPHVQMRHHMVKEQPRCQDASLYGAVAAQMSRRVIVWRCCSPDVKTRHYMELLQPRCQDASLYGAVAAQMSRRVIIRSCCSPDVKTLHYMEQLQPRCQDASLYGVIAAQCRGASSNGAVDQSQLLWSTATSEANPVPFAGIPANNCPLTNFLHNEKSYLSWYTWNWITRDLLHKRTICFTGVEANYDNKVIAIK